MDESVSAEAVANDARILTENLASFLAFSAIRRESRRGLLGLPGVALCGAGSAVFAPGCGASRHRSVVISGLRCAVRPLERWQDPVHQDRSTIDVRIREDEPKPPVHRQRCTGSARAPGAIPVLIDAVTRDKFTSHAPDLVRTDQEMSAQYAPIVLTTNRHVSTIPPDLTKRMVTCHIDAAIPENRSVTERIARRAQKDIGTALYRAYLQRLIPEVSAMRGYRRGSRGLS